MVEIRARTDAEEGWLRALLERRWGGEVQIITDELEYPMRLS